MSTKPKLSFYTNMPTPYQLDFFEALAGHFDLAVVYFTAREADRQWVLLDKGGYKVKTLRNALLARFIQKRVVSFHFSWALFRRVWFDDAPNVVVNGTYWSPNVVLILLIRKIRRKNVYFWGEPLFEVGRGFRKFVKDKILAFPLKHWSNAIFAIGKNAEKSYRSVGYDKPVHDLPYNINTALFKKESLEPAKMKKLELRWKSKGEIVLLSSGTLTRRKGMDTIIKAFRQLPRELNVCLLILGDGPGRQELQECIGDDQRIALIGFCNKEDIPFYFNLSDVFVFASRYDGWGLVVNEALAAGSAVICSDKVGAAADALVNGYNALICDPEDVNGWTDAMERLIKDESMRRKLVANSQQACVRMSSEYNAKKIYDFFTGAE